MRKCRYCNKEITDDVSFCYYCGKKIASTSKNELELDTVSYEKNKRRPHTSGKYAKQPTRKQKNKLKSKRLSRSILFVVAITILLAAWMVYDIEHETGVHTNSFIRHWNAAAKSNPNGITQGRRISREDIDQDIVLNGYTIIIHGTYNSLHEVWKVDCLFSEEQSFEQADVLELASFANPRMSNTAMDEFIHSIAHEEDKSKDGKFKGYDLFFRDSYSYPHFSVSVSPKSSIDYVYYSEDEDGISVIKSYNDTYASFDISKTAFSARFNRVMQDIFSSAGSPNPSFDINDHWNIGLDETPTYKQDITGKEVSTYIAMLTQNYNAITLHVINDKVYKIEVICLDMYNDLAVEGSRILEEAIYRVVFGFQESETERMRNLFSSSLQSAADQGMSNSGIYYHGVLKTMKTVDKAFQSWFLPCDVFSIEQFRKNGVYVVNYEDMPSGEVTESNTMTIPKGNEEKSVTEVPTEPSYYQETIPIDEDNSEWYKALYQEVLSRYYNIATGIRTVDDYLDYSNYPALEDGSRISAEIQGVSLLCRFYWDIGYQFVDLDANGIPELIIGYNDGMWSFAQNNIILDMYTISDNEAVRIFVSGERYRYNLMLNNRLLFEFSSSADLSAGKVFEYNNGELLEISSISSRESYDQFESQVKALELIPIFSINQ